MTEEGDEELFEEMHQASMPARVVWYLVGTISPPTLPAFYWT